MVDDMKNAGRRVFNSPNVVGIYLSTSYITPAEAAIRTILLDRFPAMDMLDLGVGAGRTVQHFAPLVRTYIGVDAAENMVHASRGRYPQYRFAVADAANLEEYASKSFDFILFSFNGIDHLNKDGRRRALHEMKRLLRRGGYLAYSTHNMNYLPVLFELYRLRLSRNPVRFAKSVQQFMRFRLRNHSLRSKPYPDCAVVYEYRTACAHLAGFVASVFGVPVMYARPEVE